MSAHKSNSEYSTSFVSNICAANPDDAILTCVDRLLHSISEMSEDEISDSRNSSTVIADLKEIISEIENSRVSSKESSKFCGQLSQNSNFRENASNIKGSKHRSSDLISKNSSLKAYKSNQSNSMSQDPIRSITLTEKVKDSRSTNKFSDDSDADRKATNQNISIENRNMDLNLKDLSKLKNGSKKSSHVPFSNPLISKQRGSSQRELSKRTNSGTTDVFINSMPSYPSQRPTCSWNSSGSSIDSDSSTFQTGKSTGSIQSNVNLAMPINSTLNSKSTVERPKSSATVKEIKNGVSSKSMKTISTNKEHLKSRNTALKSSSIDTNPSYRSKISYSQPSDTDERSEFIGSQSINGQSQKSQKESRPQTESSSAKLRQSNNSNSKSSNGLRVLKMSSALQEDSPNDFQYLPTESGCGGYKSSLNPHKKVDGIPSQTHKAVLFSAKKMHCDERGRGEAKIIKQEWATTRINTFDDASKTFEVMEPMKFNEVVCGGIDRTNTIFAVLPNRTTVCYVPDRSESKY